MAVEQKNVRSDDNRYRRFLAQFAATTVKNMLLFDMGMSNAFPALINDALNGEPNQFNANETLSLTPIQSSWIGSIAYIFHPIGSVFSALITDKLGRKRTMLVCNLPFVLAWFMLYRTSSVWQLFAANAMLGFAAGLLEAPIVTYVGEICEPSFRSVLISYTAVTGTLGHLLVYLLNTLMPWRTAALVCMFVPILTAIALCFVPETPLWLMSKNRTEEAEKALRWLRGWTTKEKIADEFQALQRYSGRSKSCGACIKNNQECSHPLPTTVQKLKECKRKRTLKPFFIVISLFFIAQFSGIFAMTPFLIQIFKSYESPISADHTMLLKGVVINLANISFLLLLLRFGKRKIYLTMLSGAFLCSAVLCAYGFLILPMGFNSFDKSQNFALENKSLGYIPFVSIILWSFFTYCGVNSMPWQLISEVFPYKTRGIATGLTAALNYVLCFVSKKTYYDLETTLSMPGLVLLNCIIMIFGLILMYNILPETSSRTLEDIELHISDKAKKITDRKIPKANSTSLADEEKVNMVQIKTIGCIQVDKNCPTTGYVSRKFIEDNI